MHKAMLLASALVASVGKLCMSGATAALRRRYTLDGKAPF